MSRVATSSFTGTDSEYEQVNKNPFIDNDHWAGGFAKDAWIELEEGCSREKLIQVSSRLVKNNFIAYGIIQAFLNAIMGGHMVVEFKYPDKEVEKKLNKLLRSILRTVDVNQQMPFQEFVEQMITGSAERGDILVNLIRDPGHGATSVVPELIESSRIYTPFFEYNNDLVRNGIKYSEKGKVEFYYVRKDQGLFNTTIEVEEDFVKIPAWKKVGDKQVRSAYLFLCPMNLRPNQGRQVPLLTPVMGVLRYQGQYFEAVLISARVAACFVGVMQSENVAGTRSNLRGVQSQGFTYTKLKPGMLMQSANGKGNITFASPNRPSDNQDSFLKRISMFISMSLRMPYINMYLDLSEANYSNYRGGTLEVQRMVSRWHERLKFITEWYLWNVLKDLKVNSGVRFSLNKIDFNICFPEFKSLDPEKTARADKTDIDNRVKTAESISKERGIDFDLLQDQLNKQVVVDVEREALRIKTAIDTAEKMGIPIELLLNQEEDEEKDTRSQQERDDNLDTKDEDDRKEIRKQDGNFKSSTPVESF